jgi:hypothetical protein
MKLALPAGTTAQIVHVFILDSAATDGSGKTALAFGDITAYYVRAGGTLTSLTTETIATLGTWASTGNDYLGFKKLDDTNAPGLYELDLPNNILAAGSAQVVLQLRATGAAPCCLEIQLASVPAQVQGLDDDVITAAKFDESTAYPLASADSGATEIARTGADADTLETLSDQIDGAATAGNQTTIIGHLTDIKGTGFVKDTDSLPQCLTATGFAVAGDEMALKDDAITAGKFDESSAYPLKSADTGATAIARTGADSDTLETLSDQIDGIGTSVATIVPITDEADAFSLTTGTQVSGSYTDTATDDDNHHELAPVNPGGLDCTYTFECGAGRSPVTVLLNGYWKGSGQYCDVYAWDYDLEQWDKLSNSSTRLGPKNADVNYSYPLNRENMDIAGSPGQIKVRFVSASTNTSHRLYVDCLLVATVASLSGAGSGSGGTPITPQDIWTYEQRTLTSESGEPADVDAIADAVWDETLAAHEAEGSTGAALANAASAAELPDAAAIADAVWDETASEHTGAGSTGEKMNEALGPEDLLELEALILGSAGQGTQTEMKPPGGTILGPAT